MDLQQQLTVLIKGIEDHFLQVIKTATSTPMNGNPGWYGLLLELDLEPLPMEQAKAASLTGFKYSAGALPIEVRMALEQVAIQQFSKFESTYPPQNEIQDKHFIQKAKRNVEIKIDDTIKSYVDSLRPATSLNSIFGNAQISSTRLGNQDTEVSSKKCRCCGAPRPSETDIRVCSFCGTSFFSTNN